MHGARMTSTTQYSFRSVLNAIPIVALQLAIGCSLSEYQETTGSTMGTYYRVMAKCPVSVAPLAIEEELQRINSLFSTYEPESSVSRFNRIEHRGWVETNPEVVKLVAISERVSKLSGGAFDVTVAPLVNLWGFGPQGFQSVPSPGAVEKARVLVGYERLEYTIDPPAWRKAQPLEVDFSAIAKGYGADRLLEHLLELKCANILVDIGGEVAVAGTAPMGRPWKIGIEAPDASGDVYLKVSLVGRSALATSGNYRNYIEVDGQRLVHTINPRNGFPVQHGLSSVTVIHRFAAEADGLATALVVLGPEEGLRVAEEQDLAIIMFVEDPATGGWELLASSAAEPFLVSAQ